MIQRVCSHFTDLLLLCTIQLHQPSVEFLKELADRPRTPLAGLFCLDLDFNLSTLRGLFIYVNEPVSCAAERGPQTSVW